MKKLFLVLAFVCSLVSSEAQTPGTNSLSLKDNWMAFADHISTSSNWFFETHVTYMEAAKQHFGGGAGAYYKISDNVYTGLSCDWINGGLFGMSGQFGLKTSIDLFGKGICIVTPAVYGGSGSCLSGVHVGAFTIPGTPSGTGFFGVVGTDVTFQFPKVHWMPVVAGGYEKWSCFDGGILKGALVWKL